MTDSFHNSENKPETLEISSFPQTDSITILSDGVSSLTSSNTITIDLSNISMAHSPIYSIGSGIDTISITGDSGVPFGHPSGLWKPPVPFEDAFPEWNDFQKMCKEYPGLEKVYEHMKAYYNMCKDDWEAKKKEDGG